MLNLSPEIASISTTDQQAMQQRLNHLCKPIHGLGKLERLAVKLAGIEHTQQLQTAHRCCLVFAADHGVVREGVSATPERVTAIQSVNTVNGHTTIASLAKQFNCDVEVTDVGVDAQLADPRIVNRKIRWGTDDMLGKPAMSRQEAARSITIGRERASAAIHRGNQLLLIGELGMANTTASSAILAAAYAIPVHEIVGYGSAISQKRYNHKEHIIQQVLDKQHPNPDDPLDLLSKVGGFEIGANTGAILEGAHQGVPVILDGFISIAALAIAQKFCPDIADHVIASHLSRERGMQVAIKHLGIKPVLDLDLAVGEGSGAALLLPLIDAIQSLLTNMNTLEDINTKFVK